MSFVLIQRGTVLMEKAFPAHTEQESGHYGYGDEEKSIPSTPT
jgi:hypothetical protein